MNNLLNISFSFIDSTYIAVIFTFYILPPWAKPTWHCTELTKAKSSPKSTRFYSSSGQWTENHQIVFHLNTINQMTNLLLEANLPKEIFLNERFSKWTFTELLKKIAKFCIHDRCSCSAIAFARLLAQLGWFSDVCVFHGGLPQVNSGWLFFFIF